MRRGFDINQGLKNQKTEIIKSCALDWSLRLSLNQAQA
jgi:hypothetical protein